MNEDQQIEIPNKLYFKIGEVSKLLNIEPYVLRYWESEFPEIHPGKSRTNQRLYKYKEVEKIIRIKDLLYKQKYTISGARKKLKEKEETGAPEIKVIESPQMSLFGDDKPKLMLKEIREDLAAILEVLRERKR